MDPDVFEHPLLASIHEAIMLAANVWAQDGDDRFLKGRVSGLIQAWNVTTFNLIRNIEGHANFPDLHVTRNEIYDEYLSLIHSEWGIQKR